ncbi:MAG TPA: OST-HTH/LOTUS domain-containing protein, partial [Isosphaeraceae bacterium]|nr:OST-HTH/LOTUS domain-containing protein [Isosphaeraceae bacterium]
QQLATNLNSYLPPSLNEKQREVFSLLVEACNALRRENHEILYASMIKDTMKRKKPSFDESYYGYRSFTHLLEDADDLALVDIERNPKSGTYVVTRICGEGEDRAPGTPIVPSRGPGSTVPNARRDKGATGHRR